ncbi:MAG: D-alanine--D-alanine ligase [Lachnospiraceae bacterium]|nr:D-alanine--D-alanine ligase [Lachnospiraceae bacterium]
MSRIVVLAGGVSTERDVSLITGKQIYNALKRNGHDVILTDVFLGYDIPKEYEDKPLSELFAADIDWVKDIPDIKEVDPDIDKVKALRTDGTNSYFGPNVIRLCQEADVVFMALHGENGENGRIQACFDLMGIRYTGNDYISSALSMDKGLTKDIFSTYGIPSPKGMRIKKKEYLKQKSENRLDDSIGFPCIVKACCGGSSVGVSIAEGPEDYEKALNEAYKYDEEAIIEQYIKGREFSVCVMDGKSLPVIEIAPKTGFYDYKNKYQAGATVETCPADLPEDLSNDMRKCAEKVFRALRLNSYARMDFMLDEKTGKFYCLEANTLPGMTPTSLVPQEAAAVGISFDQLCEKIIELAQR